jgi:phosphate acetyltransferase
VFADSVDGEEILDAIDVAESDVATPLMCQYRIMARARADRRHVVLPEGDDERMLRAADSLLRLGVADLTLLGEESVVRAKASAVGVDITGATILSPKAPDLVHRFTAEYTRLRAGEGMTEEQAAEIVSDVSYFGTMMVHLGIADGMVSGAAHTTAHTIVPSFQIIKTAPGTATVSSVFLMGLSDRVLRLRAITRSTRIPPPSTWPVSRSRPDDAPARPVAPLRPPRRAAYPPPFRRTDAQRGYRARR